MKIGFLETSSTEKNINNLRDMFQQIIPISEKNISRFYAKPSSGQCREGETVVSNGLNGLTIHHTSGVMVKEEIPTNRQTLIEQVRCEWNQL